MTSPADGNDLVEIHALIRDAVGALAAPQLVGNYRRLIRTRTDLLMGQLLPRAVTSLGTSTFASGK